MGAPDEVTVYVVTGGWQWESEDVMGVFSSIELARHYAGAIKSGDYVQVQSVTVDKPESIEVVHEISR